MDAVVVTKKMECAAFVGEVGTRVINVNVENNNLCNSNLLVKETDENASAKEAIITKNLAERMELDGKLSHLKISICSCKMHNSYLCLLKETGDL